MPQSERIPVAGRDVYLVTGRISQTINICTTKNVRGEYQWIIRLAVEHFVTGDDIRAQTNIEDLISWLTRKKSGQIERSPSGIDVETRGEEPVDATRR